MSAWKAALEKDLNLRQPGYQPDALPIELSMVQSEGASANRIWLAIEDMMLWKSVLKQ